MKLFKKLSSQTVLLITTLFFAILVNLTLYLFINSQIQAQPYQYGTITLKLTVITNGIPDLYDRVHLNLYNLDGTHVGGIDYAPTSVNYWFYTKDALRVGEYLGRADVKKNNETVKSSDYSIDCPSSPSDRSRKDCKIKVTNGETTQQNFTITLASPDLCKNYTSANNCAQATGCFWLYDYPATSSTNGSCVSEAEVEKGPRCRYANYFCKKGKACVDPNIDPDNPDEDTTARCIVPKQNGETCSHPDECENKECNVDPSDPTKTRKICGGTGAPPATDNQCEADPNPTLPSGEKRYKCISSGTCEAIGRKPYNDTNSSCGTAGIACCQVIVDTDDDDSKPDPKPGSTEPTVKCNGIAPRNQVCGSITSYPPGAQCPGDNWAYTGEGNDWCSWKHDNATPQQYCYTCIPVGEDPKIPGATLVPKPTTPPPANPGYCADDQKKNVKPVGTPPAGCYVSNSTWDGQVPNEYCKEKNPTGQYFYYCSSGTVNPTPIVGAGTVAPTSSSTGPATGPCAKEKGGVKSYIGPQCGGEFYDSAKASSGYFCSRAYTDLYECNNIGADGLNIKDSVPAATSACAQAPWCIAGGTPQPTVGANTPAPTQSYLVECPNDGKHICASNATCDGGAGYSVHTPGNQVCNEHTSGAKPYCCKKP